MDKLWKRPRQRIRGEKIAVIVLTVVFMLGGAGLAAVAVSFTGAIPAVSLAR